MERVSLLSGVGLSADGCLGVSQCFAGLNALVPRMIRPGGDTISAVSEPRTTATTATHLPGFSDDATFRACGRDGRHGCWRERERERERCVCVLVNLGQNKKMTNRNSHYLVWNQTYLRDVSVELTFAGLRAL